MYPITMDTDKVSIYARQSFDRHSDELAVERQLVACRKRAAAEGWTVAAEHVDNDTSATNGAERPGFEALLASNPARVLVWHTDRLVRLTKDLERVIELGVNVHALKAGHLDLSNPAGRAVARTVTAWATYETEQKALRQRSANDQRAEAGLPYKGQRAFGYEPDGVTIREGEARELRKAAEGVLNEETLRSLARDMNDRGVLTATGRAWSVTTLKAALLSPRNAGMRRHRGEVVGKGAWDAILDETTAAAVRAVLTDPSRSRVGPPRRYQLSGVMTCGKCGLPVVGAFVKGKGETYRCPTLHLSRKAQPIDDFVQALVIARLSRPDAVDLFAHPDDTVVVGDLRDEQKGIRARLDGLAEAFAAGDIDRQALAAGTRRLNERLGVIDSELAATVTAPRLADVATADDVAATFADLALQARRGIIDALLTITLLPVGRRGLSIEESVGIEWKGTK